MHTFAARLRQARLAKGYKRAGRFAQALGLEEHTYRHYERGESEPNFEVLERICHILGLTPNDLLPGAVDRGASGQESSGERYAKTA